MKLNPNQFTTIISKSPYKEEEIVYSNEERECFIKKAENWRMVRFYNELGTFEGDYEELIRTARLKPRNVVPLIPDNFVIYNGELVGVKVTCGRFSIYEGMGGWRGGAVVFYFDQYEDILKNRGKYSYVEHTRDNDVEYCSAILPVAVIEALPAFYYGRRYLGQLLG